MLIFVLQLRQSNVSKFALSGVDLLASIATPQSGQCLTVRGGKAIAEPPSIDPNG
jgi:hypothetical protein